MLTFVWHMTGCIILYNYQSADRISCGFFGEKFIIVMTKVLPFSKPPISLHCIDCKCRKPNWRNFIDGRARLLTSGEVYFENSAHK